jgi:hypothetical protein
MPQHFPTLFSVSDSHPRPETPATELLIFSPEVDPVFSVFYIKKIAFICSKTHKKKLYSIFFGVEGCAVDHPRTTIIKEEEEETPASHREMKSQHRVSPEPQGRLAALQPPW